MVEIARDEHGAPLAVGRKRRLVDVPPPARPLDLGRAPLLARDARDAELQITASTNEPLWDGARVDYGAVIDGLVGVEDLRDPGWS